MPETKLTGALIAALGEPAAIEDLVREVSDEVIRTSDEAELVVRLLELFPLSTHASSKRSVGSSLHDVLGLMQTAKDEEAITLLRERGGPELLRIFDELLRVAAPDGSSREVEDLLFLLKIVCILRPKGGLERLVKAARAPSLKNDYFWPIIFEVLANDEHPWQADVIQALRDPFPEGLCALAYLDLSNAVARSGKLVRHPFDTEAGLSLLQGWLTDNENPSFGHSAAASIPFLSLEAREKVQALADRHPDRGVQLEAAWAAAECGKARGFQALEAACAVPQEAYLAVQYLAELGAEDRIPSHTKSDDFKAICEMCQWLAHPMEFGRPPQEIRQVDTR